jgi:lysophospholipase L1-like esterase
LAIVGSPLLAGCGSSSPADVAGTGGSVGDGHTGGATATGGASPSTGGQSATGGGSAIAIATGGASSTETGGSVGSGGAIATGGISGPGGGNGESGGSRDAGTGTGITDAGTVTGTGGAAGASSTTSFDGGPPPSGKIKVWMAGDSTMQTCSGACPCGWGGEFQSYFGSNATVVNSGVSGRSIQTWLYDPNVTTMMVNGECLVSPKTYSSRWQAMLDPATGMKAGDYLFVEFGINDGDPTCAKSRHVSTALFQTYLGDMAMAAKMRGAQAIFVTSTSMMQCTGNAVMPNRGFGPETKAAGMANNVPVIDLTQLSAALYTTLGLCPNSGDFTSTTSAVGKFFCDDHTHFESAGASQIAGVVAKALRDQNIPLAAYLK